MTGYRSMGPRSVTQRRAEVFRKEVVTINGIEFYSPKSKREIIERDLMKPLDRHTLVRDFENSLTSHLGAATKGQYQFL
jgi:hypothetical protein